jgi:hypothetical protein
MKTKYIYIFPLIIFNCLIYIYSYGQTIYRLDATNNGSTITFSCPISNSRFADDGNGSTHYSNNIDYSITFCAPANKLLKFDFGCGSNSTIERIHPSDTLIVYDGNSTSSPILYKITGNASNSNRLPYFGETSSAIFTSPNSCITFRLKSGSSNNEDGWEACITCVDPISCSASNSPASDLFLGAPSVCNINNYCGQTSGDFGADYPVNLNSSGGGCPSAQNFLGTIENNSWLKFQAAETSATFVFNVPIGGGCVNGVQTAILSYNGTTLTRMTPCANSDGSWAGTFTLSTNSPLVPGNEYYLMIDGNAGDVCNYTINANTGVSIANAGINQSVCTSSTNLSASASVGTGTWSVVNGTGNFTNPNSHTTTVTGLNAGINTFRWTINTSNCGLIFDEVIIDAGCLLPVELNKFYSTCKNDFVKIEWETLSEINNKEFILEKSNNGINFEKIFSISGKGNSQEKNNYQYIDKNINNEYIYYQLKQIDYDGIIHKSNIISVEKYCLNINSLLFNIYPNPANEYIYLEFACSKESKINLTFFDQFGQEISNQNLFNEDFQPGDYKLKIDVSFLPKGFYYSKINMNDNYQIQKIIIE